MATVVVGSKVQYAVNFLRSIGATTGDIPRAKGVVTDLTQLGGMVLATIEWDRPGIPEKVNIKNLAVKGSLAACAS